MSPRSAVETITDTAPLEVARIQKNSREQVRFSLNTYKNHRLVSVRAWAKKEDGTDIPTKSGISLRIDLLADVRKALEQVELAARDAGWLGDGPNA